MRKFAVILLCFVFATGLFANTKSVYANQIRVMKELDIDTTYASDPLFISITERITTSDKKEFIDTIEYGYSYIPMLRKMISESEIPHSFLYLAMIESGLSNHAKSHVSAVGMWQFMKETARIYGLRIDRYVDERRDPIASTKAAISYLKHLKNRFGKWYLAAMAYNCGESRLSRAIKKAGTDDLSVLIDPNKKYLPLETRFFIRKILAAAFIAQDSDFLLSNDSTYFNRPNSVNISRVWVPGGIHISQVAESIGVSVKNMKIYNAHLNYDITPPTLSKYYVYIPMNKQGLFASNFVPKRYKNMAIYNVKKGDTLWGLATKFGVSVQTIKDFNNLKSNKLSINKELVMPNLNITYTIKKGDTLSAIARKFSVAQNDIKKINKIINSKLKVGDKIVIPR